MATPYTFEDTVRRLDSAVYSWLGGWHVNYSVTDTTTKRQLVNRPNVPVLRVLSTPHRAFADTLDLLVREGLMDGPTAESKRAAADYDWAVLPLPVCSIDRDDPTPSNELQYPPSPWKTDYVDAQGRFVNMPPPLHYVTVYRVTLWCMTRATHAHFMEWLMAQQGQLGAGPQGILIPVEHAAPWGTIKHQLRFTGSANLSHLEGPGPRYIRSMVSFVLRSWLFRAIDETQDGATTDTVYSLGSPVQTESDTYDSPTGSASWTENLFKNPYSIHAEERWPKTGDATVAAVSTAGVQGTVTTADDAVLITTRLAIRTLMGTGITSCTFQYTSDAPCVLELVDGAVHATNTTLRHRVVLPASTYSRRVHTFGVVQGAAFTWRIVGSGAACAFNVGLIDIREYRFNRVYPVTQSVDQGAYTRHRWASPGLSPLLIVGAVLGTTPTITVYDDVDAPRYPKTVTPIESVGSFAALTQPYRNPDNSVGGCGCDIPNTLTLQSLYAVPFPFPFNGDET